VEGAAEDLVGGGQEGDREMEKPLEGPRPTGGREMQQGGTRLPIHHGRRKAGPVPGRGGRAERDVRVGTPGAQGTRGGEDGRG
jgi:hypothetical protein